MKKLVSMLLALAMVLTLAGGAMAESVPFRNCPLQRDRVPELRGRDWRCPVTAGPVWSRADSRPRNGGKNGIEKGLQRGGCSPFFVRDFRVACGIPFLCA